jgi:hypothetical protein
MECQCKLNKKKLRGILYWHIYNILKETSLICCTGLKKRNDDSPKPMLHLAMVLISVGICVKSLRLLFKINY